MNHQKSKRLVFSLILLIFVLSFSTSCFISEKYRIIPTNPNPKNPPLKNLATEFDTEKDLIVVPDKSFRLAYCLLNNEIYEWGEQSDPVTFDEFFADVDDLLKRTEIRASLAHSRNALSKFYDMLKRGDIYFHGTSQRTKVEMKELLEEIEISWKLTINIWDARRNSLLKDSWSSEPRLFALVADDFIILLHGPTRSPERQKDVAEGLEIFLTNPRPQGDIR